MRATLATIIAAFAIVLVVGVAPLPASAQIKILPDCARTSGTAKNPRAPSLQCGLQTFSNIAQFILGVSGSFALVMFVYGGFVFTTAAGNDQRVTKGKTILTNAVIGIFIIFFSGAVIRYGLSKLLPGQELVGSACQGGQGMIVETSDGRITCETTCGTDVGEGYECVDAAQATQGQTAGQVSCIAGSSVLCKNDTSMLCCKYGGGL